MAARPRRFVDSHLHLWDAAANPWYRFPQPGEEGFGEGLKEPFQPIYLWDDYLSSLGGLDLVKWVHVTAVTEAKDVESEAAWVNAIAQGTGLPYALVGTVDSSRTFTEMEAQLDRQMANPRFKGIRLLGGADHDAPDIARLFDALAERKLCYDAVASPGAIATAAKGLARHPGVPVVIEHTGWPLQFDEPAFAQWHEEMAAFAALPFAYCKLSGLGMGLHRNDVNIFRRYFGACIELFGAERCMFGTNFPVDLSYGSAQELIEIIEKFASELSTYEADTLFSGTAERFYQISD